MQDTFDHFHDHCAQRLTQLLGADGQITGLDRKAFEAATASAASVSLKLRLNFNTTPRPNADSQLFEPLIIKPLSMERSDRLRRAFGWDRIASVDIAAFKNAPSRIKSQRDSFFDALNDWLDPTRPKHFLGRIWNVIHVNFFNAGKKARKEERETLCRVFLFASSGCNMVPFEPTPWRNAGMNYEDAVRWFLPIHKLGHTPWAKTAARMDLAFSTTIPTIVIPPNQVRVGRDIASDKTQESTKYLDEKTMNDRCPPTGSTVMNDGCARISLGAIRSIVQHLNELGMAVETMPTAFQARFNGAKGVWHRSSSFEYATDDDWDVWIETTPCKSMGKRH